MAREEVVTVVTNARQPLYALPLTFAISCVVATLATDVAYWATANIMWADFSDWLVTTGVITGWVALAVAVIEALAVRRFRRWPSWPVVIGYIVALLLATLDMLVHTRDAWTSVVPWGLALSMAVVLVLLVTAWMKREPRPHRDVRRAEVTT
jgi:uncharacterized membrane protein